VTTGPPHSMHLIGMRLQKYAGVKWVADFRDPWTSIYYFESLYPTFLTKTIHRKLEKDIIGNANTIIVASEEIAQEFQKFKHQKISKITNGYDSDDFQNLQTNTNGFVIGQVGNFTATQNHLPFWKALAELLEEDALLKAHLKIKLIGNVDLAIRLAISSEGLNDFVEYVPYIPHKEVPKALSEMRVLLLFINKTVKAKIILTGKLFEYLASSRFVLAIGPKGGELESILNHTKSGELIDFNDHDGIKPLLEKKFKEYLEGSSAQISNRPILFSRRNLTQNLVNELENVR
jgi:hypothetical protein